MKCLLILAVITVARALSLMLPTATSAPSIVGFHPPGTRYALYEQPNLNEAMLFWQGRHPQLPRG